MTEGPGCSHALTVGGHPHSSRLFLGGLLSSRARLRSPTEAMVTENVALGTTKNSQMQQRSI